MTALENVPPPATDTRLAAYVRTHWREIGDGLDAAATWYDQDSHPTPLPSCDAECDLCSDAAHSTRWLELINDLTEMIGCTWMAE